MCKERKLSSNSIVCACGHLSPDTLAEFVSKSQVNICVYIIVNKLFSVGAGEVLMKKTSI